MGKTIDIPNKKINYSPQFRNLVPGENVEFEPKDHRVTEVSSQGGGSDVPIVATPVVTVDGRTVTVTCATEGAEIFYTTDGSMPTINSTLYEGPISVTKTIHFRFVAVKNGMVNSQEATATADYFMSPVVTYDSNTGIVTLDNPNGEGNIRYTLDGTSPENGTKYTDPISLTATTTLKAIVKDSGGSSPVTEQTFLIASTPNVIERDVDYKTGSYEIVIESPDNGTIHYTTDGTNPDHESPVYTQAITRNIFAGEITVKAMVVADGMVPSKYGTLTSGESSVDAPFIEVGQDGMVTIELQGNTAGIPLQTTTANPSIGARIYYTTDGSTPTAQTGKLYTESFAKPAGNNRVKAITVCYGEYASGVFVESNVLYFVAQEDNSSISFVTNLTARNLEISFDGSN